MEGDFIKWLKSEYTETELEDLHLHIKRVQRYFYGHNNTNSDEKIKFKDYFINATFVMCVDRARLEILGDEE